MNLTLFDLDNTLIACDSDYEWGQYLVDQGVLEREEYEAQNAAYYEQYKAGTLDIHEFLGFALRPLAAHTPEDLARWHAGFMRARIRPAMTPQARALVRRHLDAGDLCAVVTATNSFVTAPIAREFGVPHLVATEPERNGERFTGRVAGTPCFREGKIARVRDWLAAQGQHRPPPACGFGRQRLVGVDRHRTAHPLEQRQVVVRVAVEGRPGEVAEAPAEAREPQLQAHHLALAE
ncbi:MAG TPA: HAD-IB family phosphatase, partial [Burkholderiales bacterium]|nr:HAD-IB family phosphatase [Burkholderiales bacterium]